MKRHVSLAKKAVLSLVAILMTSLTNAQVDIDGIWYSLSDDRTAVVQKVLGTGDIVIPATVTHKDYISNEYHTYTVTTIGLGAVAMQPAVFEKAQDITSISIPASVTKIKEHAFSGCSKITSLTLPEGLTEIGYNAFSGCGFTSITIPKGITKIPDGAFSGCTNLTEVILSGEVTSIEYCAFYGCSSLASINFPENLVNIGEDAFMSCISLTAIVLPKNLKNIDYEAFANCSKLLDVYCYAEKVPSTEADAFDGSYPEYVTLHVPASALETYKTTSPWSNFGTIVSLTGEETGIKNSELNIQNPELIYDLRGRRVEKAEKGIYIVNGKKTVIK